MQCNVINWILIEYKSLPTACHIVRSPSFFALLKPISEAAPIQFFVYVRYLGERRRRGIFNNCNMFDISIGNNQIITLEYCLYNTFDG
jgi:hypothetical protein